MLVLGRSVPSGAGGRTDTVRGVFRPSSPIVMSIALRKTRSETFARKFQWSITNKTGNTLIK